MFLVADSVHSNYREESSTMVNHCLRRCLIAAVPLLIPLSLIPTSAAEPEAVFQGSVRQESEKQAIPDAAARKQSARVIRDAYKDYYDNATSRLKKTALAEKLIRDAIETENDPSGQYMLLYIATSIASKAGDINTAFESVDEMDKRYKIDALRMKSEVASNVSNALRQPNELKALAPRIGTLINEVVAQDRYDLAGPLCRLAITTARNARDASLIKEATESIEQIKRFEKEFAAVKTALATLGEKPTDAAANLAVGKFRCFVKGDWENGVSMLALGSDPMLSALARLELAGPASATEEYKLGEGWFKLSELQNGVEKKRLQQRAAYWYEKALPDLSGLAKAVVEGRLRSLRPSETAVKEPTPTSKPVFASKKLVELSEDELHWLVRPVKRAMPFLTDRDYRLLKFPEKLRNGVFIVRNTGDFRQWLATSKLTATRDCTAFALICWQINRKVEADEEAFGKLTADGWTVLEEEVSTTLPTSRWKAVSKPIEKGEVLLPIEFGWKAGVIFAFK
jgi:hypothetical protein